MGRTAGHALAGLALALALPLGTSAGLAKSKDEKTAPAPAWNENPYPSTYRAYPGEPVAIVGATVFDGAGGRIDNGTVLVADGKVQAIGDAALAVPATYRRIDGTGKFVTPGVIDIHSHLGVYPSPGVDAHQDGNEMTSPTTPQVWAEHSVWPQDPGFSRAGQRRRHHAADPAGIGQPDRRAFGRAQERAIAHGAGHEVSRCALWHEDGLRREPQAGLWRERANALDAHGQLRGRSADVDQGRRIQAQARCRQAGGARSRHGDAGRRAGRQDPGAEPLLPR
jgi:hypothetical protein